MRLELSDELVMDISIHVTILFIFLYFFFFGIISKTGEEVLNNNIVSICNKNLKPVLNEIDRFDQAHGRNIDWESIKQKFQYMKDHPDPAINKEIEESNNYYKKVGLIISGSLILLCICIYVYFTFYKKTSINIGYILKENLIVFLLIGLIEFIFFKMTASTYIPAYPTSIGKIVLDRCKDNLQKQL